MGEPEPPELVRDAVTDPLQDALDKVRKAADGVPFQDRMRFAEGVLPILPELATVASVAAKVEIEPVKYENREPTEAEKQNAFDVIAAITELPLAKQHGISTDDFVIFVADIEGRPHLAVALNDSNGRGIAIGSWDKIFSGTAPDQFKIVVDGKSYDTREGMTREVYCGLAESVQYATEQNPVAEPDGRDAASDNYGLPTFTLLTGESVREGIESEDDRAPFVRRNFKDKSVVVKRFGRRTSDRDEGVHFRFSAILADLSIEDNIPVSPVDGLEQQNPVPSPGE